MDQSFYTSRSVLKLEMQQEGRIKTFDVCEMLVRNIHSEEMKRMVTEQQMQVHLNGKP